MDQEQLKAARVKDKTPAALQITAEQILREARDRQEIFQKRPKQNIADLEELDAFKASKRQQYEATIRKDRTNPSSWVKYATWEESMYEFERARSLFERGLDVDPRSHVLWMKYVEMEMRHKNINRARNIFDRAVQLLPRVDTFWYKYTYMEELLENVEGARQVFERWMSWEPTEEAWNAYIKFETRYNQVVNVESIYKRFVGIHPEPKNWLKWAKFEESIGRNEFAREIYESCINTLGQEYLDQNFYVSFAKFETRMKELERARGIYKYALESLPQDKKKNLYNVYTQFEKQYGGKEGLEDVVLTKRRRVYEEELAKNPSNYDTWFDYTRLEQEYGDVEKIRDVYERAIAQIPLIKEKRFWSRYIYLWLFYAIWEETVAGDLKRAAQIYNQALSLVPHKSFTFAKLWLLYAKFLVRQGDLPGARKLLGRALGTAGKDKLYKGYIELELQAREFDRVRTLYQKYLEWNPSSCFAWDKYAELEKMLEDTDRVRAIYEIAIQQPLLDMPEVLWKGYIDYEVSLNEWNKARELYQRLLDRSEHVKVWMSFADFELLALDNGKKQERAEKARSVYEKAYDCLKRKGFKEERVVLMEAFVLFEKENGSESTLQAVEKRLPKAVKKRRRLMDERGQPTGWEEYFDYIFPDDEQEQPNFKLLAMAQKWKQQQLQESEKE